MTSQPEGQNTAGVDNDAAYHRDFVEWLRGYHIGDELTEEQFYHSRALERAAKVIESLYWRARTAEARFESVQKHLFKMASATPPNFLILDPAVSPAITDTISNAGET